MAAHSISEPQTSVVLNHKFALKLGIAVVTHPLDYAKTLIQIGHEPIPPRHVTTFFGRPALALPSVFQYMGHIRRRDGFLGLWRGVTPKIIELGLTAVAYEKAGQYFPQDPIDLKSDAVLSDEEKLNKLVRATLKEASQKLACVVISQPFHVIAVRTMAQFVGGETQYGNIFASIRQVYEENGITGFWSGCIPRAIGEVSIVALSATLTYIVNSYILTDHEMKAYTPHIAGFLASSLCYPFQVVGNCMAVSRSGLIAGYPPHMPFYTSWVDCWTHLSQNKQLKRGSSLLFRYYTGPQVIVGDRVMPVNSRMFQQVKRQD